MYTTNALFNAVLSAIIGGCGVLMALNGWAKGEALEQAILTAIVVFCSVILACFPDVFEEED